MNKPGLKDLEVLIGNWDWTLSNAWFLDSLNDHTRLQDLAGVVVQAVPTAN